MSNKYALVIGVENYQNSPNIRKVQFAEADAKGMAEMLKLHGYTEPNLHLLLSGLSTKTTIESWVRTLSGVLEPNDTILVFFAGHGFSDNGHSFITCYDTQPNDLTNTSISLQYLIETIQSTDCEKIMFFLDCCESGMVLSEGMRGLIGNMSEEELKQFLKKSEYCVVFASCKPDQKSYSDGLIGHGIWTYFVIQALNGNAQDAFERGQIITAHSLQAYLAKEVPKKVRETRKPLITQTPNVFGNMSNDFILADLKTILESRKAGDTGPSIDPAKVILSQEYSGSVKSLKGFRTGYHVPTTVDKYTQTFVEGIGQAEVKEQIDELYDQIREGMGYVRSDMKQAIDKNQASIICPDFEVGVILSQNEQNPSQ